MFRAAQLRVRPIEAWLLPAILVTIVIGAVAAGLRRWFPPLASVHGAGIDTMLNYVLLTTGALFVLGHLALAWFVWRFAHAPRVTFRLATRKAERTLSIATVVLMALIAEGGVLALGLPVWNELYGAAPPADAVLVEVSAEQFNWHFRYPGPDGTLGRTRPGLMAVDNPVGLDATDAAARDDVISSGELVLPVDRPVRLRLRAKDTLHSFFLPAQRIKQDVVPGMTIEVWFTPNRAGSYEIACAELCGLGHFQMRGVLTVLSAADYDRWMRENSR